MPRFYPISLDLRGRACLVIGAGRVAERKVRSLLEAEASVRGVAHEATEALHALADEGAIALRLGEFAPADLDGVWLAIAATDDEHLNTSVARECEKRRIFANVVDVPDLCSFIVPAQVTRGPVSVAVSTGGVSPALAKWLRRRLEDVIGEEYGALAQLMGEFRPEVRGAIPAQSDRALAWKRVLDSEVLDLLKAGRTDEARALARELLGLD